MDETAPPASEKSIEIRTPAPCLRVMGRETPNRRHDDTAWDAAEIMAERAVPAVFILRSQEPEPGEGRRRLYTVSAIASSGAGQTNLQIGTPCLRPIWGEDDEIEGFVCRTENADRFEAELRELEAGIAKAQAFAPYDFTGSFNVTIVENSTIDQTEIDHLQYRSPERTAENGKIDLYALGPDPDGIYRLYALAVNKAQQLYIEARSVGTSTMDVRPGDAARLDELVHITADMDAAAADDVPPVDVVGATRWMLAHYGTVTVPLPFECCCARNPGAMPETSHEIDVIASGAIGTMAMADVAAVVIVSTDSAIDTSGSPLERLRLTMGLDTSPGVVIRNLDGICAALEQGPDGLATGIICMPDQADAIRRGIDEVAEHHRSLAGRPTTVALDTAVAFVAAASWPTAPDDIDRLIASIPKARPRPDWPSLIACGPEADGRFSLRIIRGGTPAVLPIRPTEAGDGRIKLTAAEARILRRNLPPR